MAMRMSTLFLRTLREDPADAEVPSHRLLVRAGYIRRVSPGIYTYLPLGLKVLRRVEAAERFATRAGATIDARATVASAGCGRGPLLAWTTTRRCWSATRASPGSATRRSW